MAGTVTYLQYTNEVLVDVNETELTAANFTSAVGIPNVAKQAINKAVQDIIAEELEWPFNVSTYTETLTPGTGQYALQTYRSVDWESFFINTTNIVTNGAFASNITSWTDVSGVGGTSAHTTTGNGRLRLTGTGSLAGAAEQALTTVIDRVYRVIFRHLGTDITVKIGTSSGATTNHNTSYNLDDDNGGTIHDFTFTATGLSSYLGFYNTSATVGDIDYVIVRENIRPRALKHISLDQWRKTYKESDEALSKTEYGYPKFVYFTKNDKYGITPIPDQENYEVTYDYWTTPTVMTTDATTIVIPDKYRHIVVAGAKAYVYESLSDPVFRDRAKKDFKEGVGKMRTELINRNDTMNVR